MCFHGLIVIFIYVGTLTLTLTLPVTDIQCNTWSGNSAPSRYWMLFRNYVLRHVYALLVPCLLSSFEVHIIMLFMPQVGLGQIQHLIECNKHHQEQHDSYFEYRLTEVWAAFKSQKPFYCVVVYMRTSGLWSAIYTTKSA